MEKRKGRNYGDRYGYKNQHLRLRPGLKIVHVYGEVWRIGRSGFTNHEDWGQNVLHQVIYGPDNKEYHLWGDDKVLSLELDQGRVDRHGNKSDEAKVKIFILTSILDKRVNWQFDLNIKPDTGAYLQIVYNNGTQKNVEFSGIFEDITIKKYYKSSNDFGYARTVTPMAYKKIDKKSDLSKIW